MPALTVNLNIHFLAPPEPTDAVAEVRLLRLGHRSAVGEVTMYSRGGDEPVAAVSYRVIDAGE